MLKSISGRIILPVSYEQHELTRHLLNILKTQSELTSKQLQLMLMPYAYWLNSSFNPAKMAHGTAIEFKGLDTIARLNPYLADFTEKLPNSIEINFEDTQNNGPSLSHTEDKKSLKLSLSLTEPYKNWQALAELFNIIAKEYPKPDFNIHEAHILGHTHAVKQTVLVEKPFADLRLFETDHEGPLLYIAAPISGHYTTLISDTISSALNAGFRVAVYDIKNARDVPLEHGDFGLDECVDYHREFITYLSQNIDPRVNVQAICQGTVPVSIAAATLAEEKSPYTPYTLTLDAGPINVEASETEVTAFGKKHDLDWFKNNLISKVPSSYEGQGRMVYPAFRQLSAFIAMNPEHHAHSFYEMFNHMVKGTQDDQSFKKKSEFYEEYLSGADLTAKFYLDTIKNIFIENKLAKGTMKWRSKKVDLSAYKGPLLTKEAREDDICAPAQTMFAHELMPKAKGYHYTLDNAGHYGIFSGSKARDKALPAMFTFIHKKLNDKGHDYGPLLDSYGNEIEDAKMPSRYNKKLFERTVTEQKEKWESIVKNRGKTKAFELPQITLKLPAFNMTK